MLVGHFYWIFGGIKYDMGWRNQEKTSVFSLKKEIWIEGPDLPMRVIESIQGVSSQGRKWLPKTGGANINAST